MKTFFTLVFSVLVFANCSQLKQGKKTEIKQPIVIQFIIDGLMKDAAETAIDAGAKNLKYFADNGVVVEDA